MNPSQIRQGADVSSRQAQQTKSFNQGLRYVQGFRSQIPQGNISVPINLNSSGRTLLGIAVIPVTGADISDTQITFVVNNNNMLINVNVENLNPNFVQGMIFFPTPQPLFGNDNINLNFTKNNAGTVNAIINIFYIPRLG